MRQIRHGSRRWSMATGAALTTGLVASLSACAGWGAVGQGGADSISVLMVNNPQMVDLQQLTAKHFTAETGIKVNFTVLPENDVRDKISQEFSSQARPVRRRFGEQLRDPHLRPQRLASVAGAVHREGHRLRPEGHPQADGHVAVRRGRQGLRRALLRGVLLPDVPQGRHEEARHQGARQAHVARRWPTSQRRPMASSRGWQVSACVGSQGGARSSPRSRPWSTLSAAPGSPRTGRPRSTLLPSTRRWSSMSTWCASTERSGAPQAGFTECLNNLIQGNVAMWYDATSAAGSLEAADSPVKGKIGYAAAPVDKTDSSGWLYAWSWGIQQASAKKDQRGSSSLGLR